MYFFPPKNSILSQMEGKKMEEIAKNPKLLTLSQTIGFFTSPHA
jgi:hypothetical protein